MLSLLIFDITLYYIFYRVLHPKSEGHNIFDCIYIAISYVWEALCITAYVSRWTCMEDLEYHRGWSFYTQRITSTDNTGT